MRLYLLLRHTNIFDIVPTADFGWKSHNLQVSVSWMPDKEHTFSWNLGENTLLGDSVLSLVFVKSWK